MGIRNIWPWFNTGPLPPPPQVQNLPNAALLIAKLHSLDTEVIPCAVHLLCARSLLYAGVFPQSHHLLAFPSGGYTCRVPCNLPPQLIYTGKAPSEAASRSGAVPRRFSWNALLYCEPREFPTDSILKQPAIPQWETLAAFLFCHRPWVLGLCLPICVVWNDKAYPSRAIEPLGRKCLKSLAYCAGSVT